MPRPQPFGYERRCNTCGLVKALDDFHKHKDSPLGRTYICKVCRKLKDKFIGPKPQKRCSKCQEFKPLHKFHKSKSGTFGVTHTCRACRRTGTAQAWPSLLMADLDEPKRTDRRNTYYREHRAEFKDHWLRTNFGITLEEYAEMFANQAGLCYICGLPKTEGKNRNLAVDHNHTTGQVRKLLCSGCNYRVGVIESDLYPKLLAYLKEHE